jgi:hypothetical protein
MTTAQPFRPFLVRMASGRELTVWHAVGAGCDESGHSMVVFQGDVMHLVEMRLVEELVTLTPGGRLPRGEE